MGGASSRTPRAVLVLVLIDAILYYIILYCTILYDTLQVRAPHAVLVLVPTCTSASSWTACPGSGARRPAAHVSLCVYVCIYIYIEREREGKRDMMCTSYIYIYIYVV